MNLPSRLPEGGKNVFQRIKEMCAESEKNGVKLYKLSIGQPQGPAIMSARLAAATAIMSETESMHEYQDNGSPGCPDFAQRFVRCHVKTDLQPLSEDKLIAFLPIPGIKPMLGLIPLACGQNTSADDLWVATTTKPGYPTPADWCSYLGCSVYPRELKADNRFRFSVADLATEFIYYEGICTLGIIMMNYPHNPSGQVASRQWLEELCGFCAEHRIRLFNDAAYAILGYSPEHCTLTDVAVNFPGLSWTEAFSASKAGNFTGWRIGALAGSPDFIGDIATIKGNTDSGFNAALAEGVLYAFENDVQSIAAVRQIYEQRIKLLIVCLQEHGMRLAIEPKAGFFTLWQTPKCAFGVQVESAEHFNRLMIANTGIVGVHFESYVRYAVCRDVEAMLPAINAGFKKAAVEY